MSFESVRAFFAASAPDVEIIELETGSETYSLSRAWGLKPAQIAKALTLRVGDGAVMLMACGDSRIDNKKIRAALGGKARMMPQEEAAALTGHAIGGVCPFGLAQPLPVYCDVLLRRFSVVVTGGGSTHSAVRISPSRMASLVDAQWVDVCDAPT
jgi:prolyl-tRNA editing enzyme YbaK/EbsC (Cys-tRNA(Pro) deacylase)